MLSILCDLGEFNVYEKADFASMYYFLRLLLFFTSKNNIEENSREVTNFKKRDVAVIKNDDFRDKKKYREKVRIHKK